MGQAGVPFPNAGVSFLRAIPAIGSKFGAPQSTGRMGQPAIAKGEYKGHISLYFGNCQHGKSTCHHTLPSLPRTRSAVVAHACEDAAHVGEALNDAGQGSSGLISYWGEPTDSCQSITSDKPNCRY